MKASSISTYAGAGQDNHRPESGSEHKRHPASSSAWQAGHQSARCQGQARLHLPVLCCDVHCDMCHSPGSGSSSVMDNVYLLNALRCHMRGLVAESSCRTFCSDLRRESL